MTIPNLIGKYQNHANAVALRKAYSILSNSLKQLPLSMGCPAGDYDCAGTSFSDNEDIDGYQFSQMETGSMAKKIYLLTKNLKTQKICIGDSEKCFGETFNSYMYKYGDFFVQLADGMILANTDRSALRDFSIDINGLKGPNKPARDIFTFRFSGNGRLAPAGSKEYWGKDSSAQNLLYKECTTDYVNSLDRRTTFDSYCTARVLFNGKMDY